MTDIVLISPPSRSVNHYRPPMALLYLAGHLQKHHLNILKWSEKQNKIFNQILPNLSFHFSLKYLKTILYSPKIINYLSQSYNLFREILNQKLS